MDGVKLDETGKLVSTGKTARAAGVKPPKFPYPNEVYQGILAIAKSDGLDVGEKRADNTRMVNTITGLVLNQYLAKRKVAAGKKGA